MSELDDLNRAVLAEAGETTALVAVSRTRYCSYCGQTVPHNSSCSHYGDHAQIHPEWLVDTPPLAVPKGRVPPRRPAADQSPEDTGTEVPELRGLLDYLKTGVCRDPNINNAVQEYVEAVRAELTHGDQKLTSRAAKAGIVPMLLAQRVCLTVILMAEAELSHGGRVLTETGDPKGIVKFLSQYISCFRHNQQSLGLLVRTRARTGPAAVSLADIEKEFDKKKKKEG